MHFVLSHCLAVSYIWSSPEHPDEDGSQADSLRKFLTNSPHILLVWIDWCCLPQMPRSPSETVEFQTGLSRVNMIYLSCGVLKIINSQYLSRFWPQFEAWLSYRRIHQGGTELEFGEDTRRSHDAFTGFGSDDQEQGEMMAHLVSKRWGKADLFDVLERLGLAEVAVTNQGDKKIQFEKIRSLLPIIQVVNRRHAK